MENTMRTGQNQQEQESFPVSLMVALCAMMATAVILLLVFALPAGASQTDDQIESTVKQTYVFKTYLEDDDITIAAKDGVVTLTGRVKEESNKELAGETAANIPGVTSVDNQLQLTQKSPPENSDGWVGAKVKTSLMFHRNVSGMKTDVSVKDGVVTLRGEATSQAQKDLTTEYVKDVVGVKDVKNKMTVQPMDADDKTMGSRIDDMVESIDDASITALVKMTLMYHRSTSGLGTSVETDNGVVMLHGTAKNDSEKALATKFARNVRGVKSVTNQMSIE
jgi:hyperosmotically inducible periplasmic protein